MNGFAREARVLSKLDHPRICTLFDVGEHDGIAFLAMQHLAGETLEKRLQKGALAVDQAVRFAVDIADALVAAHGVGIVHRDLKPSNIMITSRGAIVLDFGLAKTKHEIERLVGRVRDTRVKMKRQTQPAKSPRRKSLTPTETSSVQRGTVASRYR